MPQFAVIHNCKKLACTRYSSSADYSGAEECRDPTSVTASAIFKYLATTPVANPAWRESECYWPSSQSCSVSEGHVWHRNSIGKQTYQNQQSTVVWAILMNIFQCCENCWDLVVTATLPLQDLILDSHRRRQCKTGLMSWKTIIFMKGNSVDGFPLVRGGGGEHQMHSLHLLPRL